MSVTNSAKKRVAAWLARFNSKFDVEKTAIDLRAMVSNYATFRIPVLDIADGIDAVIGDSATKRSSIDPRKIKKIPKFLWVSLADLYIDPRFQRDVAPNHIKNIEAHFDSRKIIVPCAVKFVDDQGKVYFCIWDGGHTVQLLIRQGWTHAPVWYTDVEDLSHSELLEAEEAMIGLAGRSMISINKTFKRPLGGYDEFMILWETKDTDAMTIMNIMKANGCQPYRYKRQAGDVTHFEALWDIYDLQNNAGVKGTYLSRALAFHKQHWPRAAIEAEIMRPMAMIYQMSDAQLGKIPSAEFDTDLGNYLAQRFGSAEAAQEGIKDSYAAAHPNGRDNNPIQVLSGMLNIYAKHINKETVAVPPVRWDV